MCGGSQVSRVMTSRQPGPEGPAPAPGAPEYRLAAWPAEAARSLGRVCLGRKGGGVGLAGALGDKGARNSFSQVLRMRAGCQEPR